MKKSLVLAIAGLATGVVASYGQGAIYLDNYFTYGPDILYGAGVPGGTPGTALGGNNWTMGLYYAVGTVSVPPDPTGTGDPAGMGLTLGSGLGSTAPINASGTPGRGFANAFFVVPGTAAAGGTAITVMVVAYDGGSYLGSADRGHSTAFGMTVSPNTSGSPNAVGTFMSSFSVLPVPEPTTLALGGLGGLALLLMRRRQS